LERQQATVRLALSSIVAAYIAIGISAKAVAQHEAAAMAAYMVFLIAWSALLLLAIRRWPGHYPWRRLLAMVHDYTGLTTVLVIGDAFTMPVFAILIWVTVGNGMRYGQRYLAIATLLALVSLAITTSLSSFWLDRPYFVVTAFVTAMIVPVYANMLLTETRRARDAAVAASLAKTRSLAQASHDLRQPIHAISLFTACLRDAGLGVEERQMVDNIDKSLHSVAGLFRSLLNISTLDSGKVKPRFDDVAVGEVLKGIVGQNSEVAKWAGVEIRLVAPRSFVRTDPSLIAVMVQNIVSNALKYAPGRPIVVGCRRKGATLSIEVHDRGRGIAEDELGKVFDEFYRITEPGREIDGVGLGLSIVSRMAGLLGLTISIRSRLGHGTVVGIEGLPIAAEQDRARSRPPRHTRRPMLLNGMNVLLIEDDSEVLLATKTLLQTWGCQVQAETAMPQTLDAYDLIVADFDLDGTVTGGDCIASVRERLSRRVAAVVITGHDESWVRRSLGDDILVLAKPVRPSELRGALMAHRLGAKPAGKV
jgi:signal transduction histidine kinase/CheY-like chemotaxis protein